MFRNKTVSELEAMGLEVNIHYSTPCEYHDEPKEPELVRTKVVNCQTTPPAEEEGTGPNADEMLAKAKQKAENAAKRKAKKQAEMEADANETLPSVEDLHIKIRSQMVRISRLHDKETALAIVHETGAKKLAEVPAADLPALLKELEGVE